MSICNSCGGIVGQECFNQRECAEITASMNQRAYGLIDRKQQLLSVIREMDEALARVQAKFLGATSANEYEAKYLQTSDSGIFNVITAARSKAAEVVGE